MTEVLRERSLIAALEALATAAPEEGLTLEALLTRLGDRAFGMALFVLGLICWLPIPILPQIVAAPMLILSAQMAAGRCEPWLPAQIGHRRIDREGLVRTAASGRKWFGWLERLARPRLHIFAEGPGEQLCGALFFIFAVSVLIPFPFTNGVPATGIIVASLGLIMSDGLLVVIGLLIGLAWVLLLLIGGPALVFGIIGFAWGLIAG